MCLSEQLPSHALFNAVLTLSTKIHMYEKTAFVVLEFSEMITRGNANALGTKCERCFFQRDEWESVRLHAQRRAEVCL